MDKQEAENKISLILAELELDTNCSVDFVSIEDIEEPVVGQSTRTVWRQVKVHLQAPHVKRWMLGDVP